MHMAMGEISGEKPCTKLIRRKIRKDYLLFCTTGKEKVQENVEKEKRSRLVLNIQIVISLFQNIILAEQSLLQSSYHHLSNEQ